MNNQEFIKLYLDKTISIKEIAEKFQIRPQSVTNKARLLGLKGREIKTKYIPPSVGDKFGRLTFIKEKERINKHRRYWVCQCDCGNQIEVQSSAVIHKHTTSCGCFRKEVTSRKSWKGYEEISGSHWGMIMRGAKQRGLEFTITKEYIWDLFIKQDKKCKLSGLDIVLARNSVDEQTASLDRIDSKKGYVEGNVQWIHKHINIMKWDFSQEYFIKMCNLIGQKQGKIL